VSRGVDHLRRPDGEKPRVLVAGGGVAALELVLALRALAGMLAFTGTKGRERFAELLHASETGIVRSLLFVVPAGVGWPLPLYELALITARRLRAAGSTAQVTLATAERAPLELFGGRPSGQLLERLGELGIAFVSGVHVERMLRGEVRLAPSGRMLAADRVVTLPTLAGPQITGLPVDAEGFIPVDAHGAVRGAYDVYAAGDAIAYPIKHGGLATQQAVPRSDWTPDAIPLELAGAAGR
jgi:sulfide:quinone oxidoreductase